MRVAGGSDFDVGLYQAAPAAALPPASAPAGNDGDFLAQAARHLEIIKDGRVDVSTASALPAMKIKLGRVPVYGDVYLHVKAGTRFKTHASLEDGQIREIRFEVVQGYLRLIPWLPGSGITSIRLTREGHVFLSTDSSMPANLAAYLVPLIGPLLTDARFEYEPAGDFLPMALARKERDITGLATRALKTETIDTSLKGLIETAARFLNRPQAGVSAPPPAATGPTPADIAGHMAVSGFANFRGPVPLPGRPGAIVKGGTLFFRARPYWPKGPSYPVCWAPLPSVKADVRLSGATLTDPTGGRFSPREMEVRDLRISTDDLRATGPRFMEGNFRFGAAAAAMTFPGRLRPEPITIRAAARESPRIAITQAVQGQFRATLSGTEGAVSGTLYLPHLVSGPDPVSETFTPQDLEWIMDGSATATFTLTRRPDGRLALESAVEASGDVPLARVVEPVTLSAKGRATFFPRSDDLASGILSADFIAFGERADLVWSNPFGAKKLEAGFPEGHSSHRMIGHLERRPGETLIHIVENVGPYVFRFPRLADGGFQLKGKTLGPSHLSGLVLKIPDGGGETSFAIERIATRTYTNLTSRRGVIGNEMVSDFTVQGAAGIARKKYLKIWSGGNEPFIRTGARGTLTLKGRDFRIDAGELHIHEITYAGGQVALVGTVRMVHYDIPNNLLKEIQGTQVELNTIDGRPDGLKLTLIADNVILHADGTPEIHGLITLQSKKTSPVPNLPPAPLSPDNYLTFPTPPASVTEEEISTPQGETLIPWLLRTAALLLPAVREVPRVRFTIPHGAGEVRLPFLANQLILRPASGEASFAWEAPHGRVTDPRVQRLETVFHPPVPVCYAVQGHCLTQPDLRVRKIEFLAHDDPLPPRDPLASPPPLPRQRQAGEVIVQIEGLPGDYSAAQTLLKKMGLTDEDLNQIGIDRDRLTWSLPTRFADLRQLLSRFLIRTAEQRERPPEKGGTAGGGMVVDLPVDWQGLKIAADFAFQPVAVQLPEPHDLDLAFEPSLNGSRVRILRRDATGPVRIGSVTVPSVTMGPVALHGISVEGADIKLAEDRATFEGDIRIEEGAAKLGHFDINANGVEIHEPYFERGQLPGPRGQPVDYPAAGATRVTISLHGDNKKTGTAGGIHSTIFDPRIAYHFGRLFYTAARLEDPHFNFRFRHFGLSDVDLHAHGIGVTLEIPAGETPFEIEKATLTWKEELMAARGGTLVLGETRLPLGDNTLMEEGVLRVTPKKASFSARRARVCVPTIETEWIKKIFKVPGLAIEGTEFHDTCFEGAFTQDSTLAQGNLRLRGDFAITSRGLLKGKYGESNEFSSPVAVSLGHVRAFDYRGNRLRRFVFEKAIYSFDNIDALIVLAGTLGLRLSPFSIEADEADPQHRSRAEVKIDRGEIRFGNTGELESLAFEGLRIAGQGWGISAIVSEGKLRVMSPRTHLNGRVAFSVKVDRNEAGERRVIVTDHHVDVRIDSHQTALHP